MSRSTWIVFADSVPASLRANVVTLLEAAGVATTPLAEGTTGVGIVVLDAADESLLALLRRSSHDADVLCICIGASSLSHPTLWSLVDAGAADVLTWPELPQHAEDVSCRLKRWSTLNQLAGSAKVMRSLVGASPAWRTMVRGVVEGAAFTSSPVLITGESGTGKELIASLIHDLDPRPDKGAFVVVDCTTMSPELSGSELFGHERGAFTGATAPRDGAFALAHKGTLFLDEVGELSPTLQAQLLRVVQERHFKRVGGNSWQTTDFRLVCATHRDLEHGVASGTFRADLFHRIAGWRCQTVPLRQRKDDILLLARHFMAELMPGVRPVELDTVVREFLLTREYPGNVRDLRQLVARMVHRHAGGGAITIGDIPHQDRKDIDPAQRRWPESTFRSAVRLALNLGIGMKDIGQAATELAVEVALELEEGNLQRAALRLGVTDRALQLRRATQRGAG